MSTPDSLQALIEDFKTLLSLSPQPSWRTLSAAKNDLSAASIIASKQNLNFSSQKFFLEPNEEKIDLTAEPLTSKDSFLNSKISPQSPDLVETTSKTFHSDSLHEPSSLHSHLPNIEQQNSLPKSPVIVSSHIGPFAIEQAPEVIFLDCVPTKKWFEKHPFHFKSQESLSPSINYIKNPRLSPIVIVHGAQCQIKPSLEKLAKAIKSHFAHCTCYLDHPNLQEQVRLGLVNQTLRLVIVDSELKAEIWDPQKTNILVINATDLETPSLKIRLWRRIENALKIY
jgi:hypothetical protein